MKPFYYLSDFPERKNAGQNFVAECPKCGKKHLSISKKTGAFHCFYAGCDFNGKLKDFWEERPYSDSSFTGNTGGNYTRTSKTTHYTGKGNDAACSNSSTISGKSTSEVQTKAFRWKKQSKLISDVSHTAAMARTMRKKPPEPSITASHT